MKRRGDGRWRMLTLGALGVALIAAAIALFVVDDSGGGHSHSRVKRLVAPAALGKGRHRHKEKAPSIKPPPGISLAGRNLPGLHLKPRPKAALLFDVNSGRVLWSLHPLRVRPIASVTKIMTALLTTERLPVGATARISKKAVRYTGSEVGVLPRGHRVKVETLLYGLLLPSGNDAAVALAERMAGSDHAFARLMNRRAHELGLTCTHYVSSYGLQEGNRSCPADLAALARTAIREPRIARIVAHSKASLKFPFVPGGRLVLYSTNPLYRLHYKGTIGMKTGFTDPAGHCLVAIARRGTRTLGAVLLNSPDTGGQAKQLLDAGFNLSAG